MELIYENEERGQTLRVAVSPGGEEQEIADDYEEQGGADDGFPSMVKLYLQDGGTLRYAEVWVDGDVVTEHTGVCGRNRRGHRVPDRRRGRLAGVPDRF